MNPTTNISQPLESTAGVQPLAGEMSLRIQPGAGTASTSSPSAEGAANSRAGSAFEVVPPVPVPLPTHKDVFDSKPIQIWEGVVLSVDRNGMDVRLNAKLARLPEHTATIALEWIHDQDRDLARPGAIFYLTVFRKLSRGSVQNAQEIRFRRLPNWSNSDVLKVRAAASALAARMKDTDDAARP